MAGGSLIGGIVGAVIGFYFGGPTGAEYGWAIGAVAGGVLDPDRVDGPRLQDRKVQTSSYGVAIPIIYGGDAGAGNVIWSTDLQEHDVEDDGKGGPVTTNHTYSVSCAILIGEGPVAGIRRIWADSKLIYDASLDASNDTIVASSLLATYFTFYSGSEDQMPDPTMEAVLGVGNVSAYRGYCYVVFNEIPLQDYGNRLPNFRFETSKAVTEVVTPDSFTYEPLTIGSWGGAPAPHSGNDVYTDMFGAGQSWTDFGSAAAGNAALYAGQANPVLATAVYSTTCIGYATSTNNNCNLFPDGATLDDNPQYCYYFMAVQTPDKVVNLTSTGLPFPDDVTFCGPLSIAGAEPNDGIVYMDRDAINVGTSTSALVKIITGSTPTPQFALINNCDGGNFPGFGSTSALGNGIVGIRVERMPSPPVDDPGCLPGDPCLLGFAELPSDSNYCINCDGVITRKEVTTYEVITGTFRQLIEPIYVGGVLVQNALGPVLLTTDPNYANAGFWATEVANAIAAGKLDPDIAGAAPSTVSAVAKGTHGFATQFLAEEANTTLDVIVADIWRRCGGAADELDITALEGIVVQGFSIATQMAGRAAILPLQQVYWWDFVESGRKLKAVLRGQASAVTMSVDDLGATEGTDQLPAVVPTRGQESELPATLNVSYPVRATGYEVGTQRARRVTTQSKQSVNLEVAVVMLDQLGAEVADVNMYAAWTGRTTREWSTTRKFAAYEPTDVVTLDDDEFEALVRITDRAEDGGVINWKGQDERPAVYAPNVTPGNSSGSGVGPVRHDGPMKLELIDSPIVSDSNDDAGSYAAVSGYSDTWPGGSAWESVDGGSSFVRVKSLTAKATIGYAQDVLGPFDGGNTVDESNSVTVSMHNGSLASITYAALLSNGNAAVLGNEIIQFRSAELVADGVYRLSGLLRGRQGTEQHIGTHALMDRFVLFTSAVYRMPPELANINIPAVWKGVTSGQTLDQSTPVNFTNTCAGLKPLSPVHLYAADLGTGLYRLNWVRRTRIAPQWRDSVDVPLGETSESYAVVVTHAGVDTALTVSSPTVDVAAVAGDSISVYQLSSTVGRGFPATVQL